MLPKVYSKDSLTLFNVFHWYQRFKNRFEGLEDNPRSGCPSTSTFDDNVAKIREIIKMDRHLTLRMLEEALGISKDSCHTISRD